MSSVYKLYNYYTIVHQIWNFKPDEFSTDSLNDSTANIYESHPKNIYLKNSPTFGICLVGFEKGFRGSL